MTKPKPDALRVVEATHGKIKKVKETWLKIYYPY
jgi:hypothetical protein